MPDWLLSVGSNLAGSGFGDDLEMPWLNAIKEATFDELSDSTRGGKYERERFSKLDGALANAVQTIIANSKEAIKSDVFLKRRELGKQDKVLRGSQFIWMMLDFFKTNRSFSEVYTWQDVSSIKWLGDEKLGEFYAKWRSVVDVLTVEVDPKTLTETFLELIRPSKVLAPDIHEFDRFDLDDPRRNLKW